MRRSANAPITVYVTAPSIKEAARIAEVLLKEKLIACANILESHSLYQWKGRMTKSTEAVIFMKSMQKHFKAIERSVKALSSYECPCIVAIPIVSGSKGYLAWSASALS